MDLQRQPTESSMENLNIVVKKQVLMECYCILSTLSIIWPKLSVCDVNADVFILLGYII